MSDESPEPSSPNAIKSLTSLATPLVFSESGLTSIDTNRIKSQGKSFWHSLQDTFEHSIESIPEEISKQVDSAITDVTEKVNDYQLDKRVESSVDSLNNAFDVFKW